MKNLSISLFALTLFACSSDKANLTQRQPSQSTQVPVYMSTIKAPKSCNFVGLVYGPHQTFTSGGNIHLGKNITQAHITQAREMGANYVEMNELEDQGKGYICSKNELSKLNLKPY